MLSAALLAMLFRVNLPVALFTTLYTNPFTILPLYVLAYELGAWVLGQKGVATVPIVMPDLSWNDWFSPLIHWLYSLGKEFAIGLPLLAISLSVLGYLLVRLLWRCRVLWELRKRRARHHSKETNDD